MFEHGDSGDSKKRNNRFLCHFFFTGKRHKLIHIYRRLCFSLLRLVLVSGTVEESLEVLATGSCGTRFLGEGACPIRVR